MAEEQTETYDVFLKDLNVEKQVELVEFSREFIPDSVLSSRKPMMVVRKPNAVELMKRELAKHVIMAIRKTCGQNCEECTDESCPIYPMRDDLKDF